MCYGYPVQWLPRVRSGTRCGPPRKGLSAPGVPGCALYPSGQRQFPPGKVKPGYGEQQKVSAGGRACSVVGERVRDQHLSTCLNTRHQGVRHSISPKAGNAHSAWARGTHKRHTSDHRHTHPTSEHQHTRWRGKQRCVHLFPHRCKAAFGGLQQCILHRQVLLLRTCEHST